MKVLVVAEPGGERLAESTAKCVACARELRPDAIDIAVFTDGGRTGAAAVEAAAGIDGADRVLEIPGDDQRGLPSAVLAPRLAALAAAGYTHLLGPSTTFGKDLMPRAAALLGVGQISDVMAVEGPYRFKRPIYAGNVIVTLDAPAGRLVVATVRQASYRPAGPAATPAPVETRSFGSAPVPGHTRVLGVAGQETDRPDLQTARRVVAAGRAVDGPHGLALVQRLADALGAAIGASRAAVDAGLVSNDMQIGQTGKVIAPDLYVAVGISGAIQHLTGIKDAGTIVAINNDAEAPIFEIADLGLVADLFEAVPDLIAAVESGSTSAEARPEPAPKRTRSPTE